MLTPIKVEGDVMSTIFALSDIHGYYEEMIKTLKQVDLDSNEENILIFLGDYINRGTESAKVLYKLKEIEETYPNQVVVLVGNHDVALVDWLDGKIEHFEWSPLDHHLYTIRSFFDEDEFDEITNRAIRENFTGDDLYRKYANLIVENHSTLINWLKRKCLSEKYYETEEQIFVHAGINEDHGEMWKIVTEDYVFTEKFPAEVGYFYKDIVAGHVSSAIVSGNDEYLGKVFWDQINHFYIDGDTPVSRQIPLLKYDTETKVYSSFELNDDGKMMEYTITQKY